MISITGIRKNRWDSGLGTGKAEREQPLDFWHETNESTGCLTLRQRFEVHNSTEIKKKEERTSP